MRSRLSVRPEVKSDAPAGGTHRAKILYQCSSTGNTETETSLRIPGRFRAKGGWARRSEESRSSSRNTASSF